MSYILLLYASDETTYAIQSWLPISINLVSVSNLDVAVGDLPDIDQTILIVLDASNISQAARLCKTICTTFPQTAVMVILSNPDDRPAVFEAGAYDVFLTPLCQAEVNARLDNCIRTIVLAKEQEELEVYAAQMAFVMLITRLLDDRLELTTILSQTLEQIANLTNAAGAEIWLCNTETQQLELATALRGSSSHGRDTRQPFHDPTWVEKILSQKKPVFLTSPEHQEELENWDPKASEGSLLGIALSNRDIQAGLLLLYKRAPDVFSPQESTFAENLAPLISTAITNNLLMDQLRRYAERQRILYEMGNQIIPELDIKQALHRTVQWLIRISGAESAVIWLVDENETHLLAEAAFGIDISSQTASLPLTASVPHQPALFIHDPLNCNECCQAYRNALQISFTNIHILPMRSRGRVIGAATLFNRIGGEPHREDTEFIITAIKMISVAIANSRMHTHLVELMEGHERRHQEALQDERLLTIGRLTASLAHEINNPMQAIRGAIDLALEELDHPFELAEYLHLSLKESDRVIRLVNRMRQLYRPANDRPERLNLHSVIQEALETGQQELSRQNVTIQLLGKGDLYIIGILNQLHLIFLSILLTLCDALGHQNGGEIIISIKELRNLVWADFSISGAKITPEMINHRDSTTQNTLHEETQMLSGLSLTLDIIKANQGRFSTHHTGSQAILRVELPKIRS